jgi:hypothetical protein
MKNLMILGGCLGFVGGSLIAWMNQDEVLVLLTKACLATCIGGWLLRWWGQLWLNSLKVAVQEELQQRDAEPIQETTIPSESEDT